MGKGLKGFVLNTGKNVAIGAISSYALGKVYEKFFQEKVESYVSGKMQDKFMGMINSTAAPESLLDLANIKPENLMNGATNFDINNININSIKNTVTTNVQTSATNGLEALSNGINSKAESAKENFTKIVNGDIPNLSEVVSLDSVKNKIDSSTKNINLESNVNSVTNSLQNTFNSKNTDLSDSLKSGVNGIVDTGKNQVKKKVDGYKTMYNLFSNTKSGDINKIYNDMSSDIEGMNFETSKEDMSNEMSSMIDSMINDRLSKINFTSL